MLDVKTAGEEQAHWLRARSFLLDLFERAALFELERRFGVSDDDVLVRGGGFTVRLPANTDTGELEQFAADMQQRLWRETGGEVQFALGWAAARRNRPAPAWSVKNASQPALCYKKMDSGRLPPAQSLRCPLRASVTFAVTPGVSRSGLNPKRTRTRFAQSASRPRASAVI